MGENHGIQYELPRGIDNIGYILYNNYERQRRKNRDACYIKI